MMIEEGKIEKETIKEKRMIEEEIEAMIEEMRIKETEAMIEEERIKEERMVEEEIEAMIEEIEATIEEEIEATTEEATTEDPLQETVIVETVIPEETEATIEESLQEIIIVITQDPLQEIIIVITQDPLQETVIDIIQKNEIIHHLGIIHTIKINLENMIIEIRQYQIVLHEGEVLLHIDINFNLFFYVNLPFLTYSCYNKQFNNNNNNNLFNASYE